MDVAARKGAYVREPLRFASVRGVRGLLLAEMTDLLEPLRRSGGDGPVVLPDDEVLREAWQEVGDDLRQAMREYPLSEARREYLLSGTRG